MTPRDIIKRAMLLYEASYGSTLNIIDESSFMLDLEYNQDMEYFKKKFFAHDYIKAWSDPNYKMCDYDRMLFDMINKLGW